MTEFHLIVESLSPVDSAAPKSEPESEPLRIASGAWTLCIKSGKTPHLKRYNSDAMDDRIVLESVHIGAQAQLAVLSPGSVRVRVNGQPAPRVVLVQERDQVQVHGTQYVLHVTRYHQPRLGPSPKAVQGKECPVCRGRIKADSTIYVCPCGAAVHCEGEERPADERLECLKLSTDCPVCGTSVVLTQGYSYVPEF